MPLPAETIRLYLTRHGDEWTLAGASRTVGPYGVLEKDAALEAATIVELGADAISPGEVLEAIARVLDRREAERITAAAAAGQSDDVADVGRVVEVLERVLGRDPLRAPSIADLAGLDLERAIAALERAELDGVVELVATTGDGVRLYRLDRRVIAIDEQRRAAQDDPRGEADR